jgi:homogentisate 1,2-dioxygenase
VSLWAVRGTAVRHGVYRTPREQPALLAVPHPPGGGTRRISRGGVGIISAASAPRVVAEPVSLDPLPLPATPADFVDGLLPVAVNGSAESHAGCAIYLYAADRPMRRRFFYSGDGELLIVPQLGTLTLDTELGRLVVEPQQIAVIPRGLRFRVDLTAGGARGYVCENFGAPFALPDLGPIGSNGLANPRDFLTPVARYEDVAGEHELIAKFLGRLWSAPMDHSTLDVVAWHGNNAPYRYDLRRFNAMGSVSYDHPDPSIFLVLHSPSGTPGTGNLDFVVFPPRWLAMQDTFRPPWFHRNVASEYMGLIRGVYDAKSTGFVPGGSSLHNCMSGHGPDAATVEKAVAADTATPVHVGDTLAFMFESRFVIQPTETAMRGRPPLQHDYSDCWRGLARRFDPQRP